MPKKNQSNVLAEKLTIADMYLAYRKAKVDVFYESTHYHALAFSKYEQKLEANLRRLLSCLTRPNGPWYKTVSDIGSFAYIPKDLESSPKGSGSEMFYTSLDPLKEWTRIWGKGQAGLAKAKLRLVIVPTVDFSILSALWIIKVGHKYDAVINPAVSYGNRLRRLRDVKGDSGAIGKLNKDCLGLFAPYFGAYQAWRRNGLQAMRKSLDEGNEIHAVTMDVRQFYHQTSPKFVLRNRFLSTAGISLDSAEVALTRVLLDSIDTWYASTPDYEIRPEGALPVGLSASKIISNVLLAEFDQHVVSRLKPIYYGRYVDDVFLVVRAEESEADAKSLISRIAVSLKGVARIDRTDQDHLGLVLDVPYARDSKVVFAGAKQKVFHLSGRHGLDLVGHIEAQIRKLSSEHRLLPVLPSKSEDMATKTLMAQSAATLEPDALRKADAMSVRRLGLALLLRDAEAYERDLAPKDWKDIRFEFYGLVDRHVLSPTGLFNYYAYLNRVFGLMVACGDALIAQTFVRKANQIVDLLEETSTLGTESKNLVGSFRHHLSGALFQVALQASSVKGFRWSGDFLQLIDDIQQLVGTNRRGRTKMQLQELSKQLMYCDLGRRPYRELWLQKLARKKAPPKVPASHAVRKLLRLAAIRRFRKAAGLNVPYWPALTFPTRPIGLTEISVAAPHFLKSPPQLRDALFAFRGARTQQENGVLVVEEESSSGLREVHVWSKGKSKYRIALPSVLTTERDWIAAVQGNPSVGLHRYRRIKQLVNDVLRHPVSPDVVVFPECSMPRAWANTIAFALARKGISLIAGLEYEVTRQGLRNEALVSLASNWAWSSTGVSLYQPKFHPAHEEARLLYKFGRRKLFRPKPPFDKPTVYFWGDVAFSVLICSDLTDILNRSTVHGGLDAIFVIEWNKDLDTFSSLVEATAADLHLYVIQSNNRLYGDSRIRAPLKERFNRDIVRVRGGVEDFHVFAEIDVNALRRFQTSKPKSSNGPFKPVPVGYKIADYRKA